VARTGVDRRSLRRKGNLRSKEKGKRKGEKRTWLEGREGRKAVDLVRNVCRYASSRLLKREGRNRGKKALILGKTQWSQLSADALALIKGPTN